MAAVKPTVVADSSRKALGGAARKALLPAMAVPQRASNWSDRAVVMPYLVLLQILAVSASSPITLSPPLAFGRGAQTAVRS